MARYSDPSQAEAASLNRFYVWNSSSDPYSHDELAKNWDRVDAMIGRPSGDSAAWPPTQGAGGGIWREVQMLQNERADIGDVKMWWYPFSGAESLAQIEARVPSGWVLCDGRKVLAADHEFPGISTDIYVPDMRNGVPIGAAIKHVNGSINSLVAPGTAGIAITSNADTITRANDATGAPGILRTGAPLTTGADGIVRATMIGATGVNVLPNVAVPVPDHFHEYVHSHWQGSRSQRIDGTTGKQQNVSQSSGKYWMLGSGQGENSQQAFTWSGGATFTTQTLYALSTMSHDHTYGFDVSFEDGITSRPRGSFDNTNALGARYVGPTADAQRERPYTSYQIRANGAAGYPGRYSAADWPGDSSYGKGTSGGSNLSGAVTIDRRQRSIPLLFLIKVKHSTAIS